MSPILATLGRDSPDGHNSLATHLSHSTLHTSLQLLGQDLQSTDNTDIMLVAGQTVISMTRFILLLNI